MLILDTLISLIWINGCSWYPTISGDFFIQESSFPVIYFCSSYLNASSYNRILLSLYNKGWIFECVFDSFQEWNNIHKNLYDLNNPVFNFIVSKINSVQIYSSYRNIFRKNMIKNGVSQVHPQYSVIQQKISEIRFPIQNFQSTHIVAIL